MAQPCWAGEVDKVRFLEALFTQVGLFGDTVEDCAQQFPAVLKQTCLFQYWHRHILPRRDAPQGKPQSARCRGCPPVSSKAAPPRAWSLARPACRASRGSLSTHLWPVPLGTWGVRRGCVRMRCLLYYPTRAWQYRVLPFGLSLSPRVFMKVIEGTLARYGKWASGSRWV